MPEPPAPDPGPGPPGDHVVGVGVASRAEAGEVAALVAAALREADIARDRVAAVATVATRADHPAVTALGWPVVAFSSDALAATREDDRPAGDAAGRERPRVVVAEPAALLAAGPGAVLVVPKRRSARATVAVARAEPNGVAHIPSNVRSSRPRTPRVSSG